MIGKLYEPPQIARSSAARSRVPADPGFVVRYVGSVGQGSQSKFESASDKAQSEYRLVVRLRTMTDRNSYQRFPLITAGRQGAIAGSSSRRQPGRLAQQGQEADSGGTNSVLEAHLSPDPALKKTASPPPQGARTPQLSRRNSTAESADSDSAYSSRENSHDKRSCDQVQSHRQAVVKRAQSGPTAPKSSRKAQRDAHALRMLSRRGLTQDGADSDSDYSSREGSHDESFSRLKPGSGKKRLLSAAQRRLKRRQARRARSSDADRKPALPAQSPQVAPQPFPQADPDAVTPPVSASPSSSDTDDSSVSLTQDKTASQQTPQTATPGGGGSNAPTPAPRRPPLVDSASLFSPSLVMAQQKKFEAAQSPQVDPDAVPPTEPPPIPNPGGTTPGEAANLPGPLAPGATSDSDSSDSDR